RLKPERRLASFGNPGKTVGEALRPNPAMISPLHKAVVMCQGEMQAGTLSVLKCYTSAIFNPSTKASMGSTTSSHLDHGHVTSPACPFLIFFALWLEGSNIPVVHELSTQLQTARDPGPPCSPNATAQIPVFSLASKLLHLPQFFQLRWTHHAQLGQPTEKFHGKNRDSANTQGPSTRPPAFVSSAARGGPAVGRSPAGAPQAPTAERVPRELTVCSGTSCGGASRGRDEEPAALFLHDVIHASVAATDSCDPGTIMVKMSQGRLTLPPCFLSRAQNWSFLKGYDPMPVTLTVPSPQGNKKGPVKLLGYVPLFSDTVPSSTSQAVGSRVDTPREKALISLDFFFAEGFRKKELGDELQPIREEGRAGLPPSLRRKLGSLSNLRSHAWAKVSGQYSQGQGHIVAASQDEQVSPLGLGWSKTAAGGSLKTLSAFLP
ncbi:hypothetical protein E2I00_000434, partial [Balaenoptera physalus]